MSLTPFTSDASGTIFLAVLDCLDYRMWDESVAIIFQSLSDLEVQYAKIVPEMLLETRLGRFKLPLRSLSEAFRNRHEATGLEPTSRIKASRSLIIYSLDSLRGRQALSQGFILSKGSTRACRLGTILCHPLHHMLHRAGNGTPTTQFQFLTPKNHGCNGVKQQLSSTTRLISRASSLMRSLNNSKLPI